MSLFGKILAFLNVLAVFGAVALIAMDYAKRRSWEYAVFREDLMIHGLPLDNEETDGQGRLLHERIGKQTQQELFAGRSPVTTQVDEVNRVKGELQNKINAAGEKKKQIYLYSRVLLPLSLTNEQRQAMLAYQAYLKDDASYQRLVKLITDADTEAKKKEGKKPYEVAFTDALALQYSDPPGPLAEAFLAAKKNDVRLAVPQALEAALDAQLAQLQGQFDQAFREATEIKPKANMDNRKVKSDAPSERKRIIAHLLFSLVDVLPDEAPGAAAPKPDLTANENYKRFVIVVGVRAAAAAVNDEAALLRDMAAEVAAERDRDRSVYAVEHRKAVDLVVDKTVQLDMHRLLLERKQKELADHEADLVRRRADVKFYQNQLAEVREETAKHLKELRAMSDVLYQKRVELRDDTVENQKREKKIRQLEYQSGLVRGKRTMTVFGKALVLFNLAFSLLLAAWAFSLYANGIDWSDKKEGSPPAPVGQFAVREAQLEEAWKGVPPAQANWLTERRKLLDEEARRAAERAWYDEEMRHVFVTATADKPLGEIKVAEKDDDRAGVRKGQVLLDDKGFPLLVPLKDRAKNPLQALAVYNKQDEDVLKAIKEVLTKHQTQIDEAIKLTDLIIGDKAKGIRGLQQRILDEQTKDADLLAEQKLVKPQLINTVVELELIAKRRDQLKKRIEELEKINVASK